MRRLLLSGLLVPLFPDVSRKESSANFRLLLAVLINVFYASMTMVYRPYRHATNNALAAASSLLLFLILISTMLVRILSNFDDCSEQGEALVVHLFGFSIFGYVYVTLTPYGISLFMVGLCLAYIAIAILVIGKIAIGVGRRARQYEVQLRIVTSDVHSWVWTYAHVHMHICTCACTHMHTGAAEDSGLRRSHVDDQAAPICACVHAYRCS